MGENRKKFKLTTAILAVICVVFVAEAAAPVAAIGNSQYFWWIFMMIAFLLPYGLIAAELGTTYDGEGGIYDWISKAYGRRMGSRTALVLLGEFPSVDGIFSCTFSGNHRKTGRRTDQCLAFHSHRAGFYLDRRRHQLLPDFRQHLDPEHIGLHQADFSHRRRRTGNLYGADEGSGQRIYALLAAALFRSEEPVLYLGDHFQFPGL